MTVSMKVEIAFTSAPLDTSPAWTDVTSWVKEDSGKRGRSAELEQVGTGTRTIVFDNTDGRFTAGRASSPVPFRGNIKPRRPVRVTFKNGATTYARFYGLTDDWDSGAPGGGAYSEATLTVVDGFDFLGNLPISTPYRCQILADGPKAFYPLTIGDDSSNLYGAALGNLSKHQEGPLYTGAYRGPGVNDDAWDQLKANILRPSTFPLVRGDGEYQALRFGAGSDANQPITTGAYARTIPDNLLGFEHETFTGISNTSSFTFEFWMSVGSVVNQYTWYAGYLNQGRTNPAFVVLIHNAGFGLAELEVRWYTDPAGGPSYESYKTTIPLNRKPIGAYGFEPDPHHIVITSEGLTRQSWGVQKVYIDGTLRGTKDLTGSYAVSAGDFYVGHPLFGPQPSAAPATAPGGGFSEASPAWVGPYESAVGQVALYDRIVLTPEKVLEHYLAGALAWFGDPGYRRINRVLDWAGWPAEWRYIDEADAGALLGCDWDDRTKVLSILQDAEEADGGLLFINGAGSIVYQGRLYRTHATPVATFEVDTESAPGAPLTWSTNDSRLVNIVNARRDTPGGIETTVIDHPSVAEYGEAPMDLPLKVASDKEVIDRARQMIQRYRNPDVRVSALTLTPMTQLQWDLALGLEIGDLIVLDNLPSHAPDDNLAYFVESVSDSTKIDGEGQPQSTFTFDLTPAAIWLNWVDPETTTTVPDESGGDDGTVNRPANVVDGHASSDASSVTISWVHPDEAVPPANVSSGSSESTSDSITVNWEAP